MRALFDAVRSGRAARVALSRVAESTRTRLWEPLERRLGQPTALQMTQGLGAETDPLVFLSEVLPTADVAASAVEFSSVWEELGARRREAQLVYGDLFAVEEQTSLCLYSMTRAMQPAHVLETGVADGVSSSVILAAMARNGFGVLHSTDIRPDAGVLVADRSHWDLHLLDRRFPARSLNAYVNALPELGLFVHDSLHRRPWQLHELRLAYDRIPPGGILASDDADSSFAFADFCQSHDLEPHYLFDKRKFFAAAVKK